MHMVPFFFFLTKMYLFQLNGLAEFYKFVLFGY